MYTFLLLAWINKTVTRERLATYIPLFITQEQYEVIITTKQND